MIDEERLKQLEELNKFLTKHGEKVQEALEGQKIIELKDRLRGKFDNMSVPMDKVKYSRKNYDALFPNGKVSTPLGQRNLRGDQFAKLGRKDKGMRRKYMGGMAQTYNDPIAIINAKRDGEEFEYFGKSFNNLPKNEIMLPVAETIKKGKNKGQKQGITTHPRGLNYLLEQIKSPSNLVYKKPDGGTANMDNNPVRPAGTDVENNISRLSKNVLQVPPDVKREWDGNTKAHIKALYKWER